MELGPQDRMVLRRCRSPCYHWDVVADPRDCQVSARKVSASRLQ